MFCLNNKNKELEKKQIEKFKNYDISYMSSNYKKGIIAILTLLFIIIFCIIYFKPFALQKIRPKVIKSNTNIKIFGPDDIISPLLTSSSEISSLK